MFTPLGYCYKQVRERGPYVYRELVHRKIDVQFAGTTTEFRVWRQQRFDEELTTVECGPRCTEHDQVSAFDSHFQFAINFLPFLSVLPSFYLFAVL